MSVPRAVGYVAVPAHVDAEGREEVVAETAPGLAGFDVARAHPARVYDVWCGGKDGFATDRAAAAKVAEVAPWVVAGARGNRAFVARAVKSLARQGIRQFVDLGSGMPSSSNVHQVAQRVDPACRVAYVDHDPIVLAHARALLAGDPGVVVVGGDLRNPDVILADPDLRALIDLTQPVAVLLAAVLHFVVSDDEAADITARIRDRVTPGSFLVLSHVADLPDTAGRPRRAAATTEGARVYRELAGPFTLRAQQQIGALFDGFDLVDPGLVPANRWRPVRRKPGPAIPVLAGIGHRPGSDPVQAGAGPGAGDGTGGPS
jgi:SAM-dependent methyltransferase